MLWKDINDKQIEIEFNQNIPFEPSFELAKTNPNKLFKYYYEDIIKVATKFSLYKNFDKNELMQQSYIYFVQYCQKYDPYFGDGDNFYKFKNGVFKHIIQNIKAYTQRYYFKRKREQPVDLFDHDTDDKNNTKEVVFQKFIDQNDAIETFENKEYLQYLLSFLTKRQQQIVTMLNNGILQDSVAKKFGLSQSRISAINKKSLQKMYKFANNIKDNKDLRSNKRCNL